MTVRIVPYLEPQQQKNFNDLEKLAKSVIMKYQNDKNLNTMDALNCMEYKQYITQMVEIQRLNVKMKVMIT